MMTSEVDGLRRMGNQDAVKKNDMGMILNESNWVNLLMTSSKIHLMTC